MGDETEQFASRFSNALNDLALFAGDDVHAPIRKVQGAKLAAVVRDALDAVAAVFETGTKAVRDWPERRGRVLAQIAAMRETLGRSGVDDELRRMARDLIELVEPRSARR
jgi:hypothetical protein